MHEITLSTGKKTDIVDITAEIEDIVNKSGIKEGLCHIFVPHTTAGVFLNENADLTVRADISEALDRIIPSNIKYKHSEGNSDAHIKATLTGSAQTVFVKNGTLRLGTWQGIYFGEFDGPRTRTVWVALQEL